MAENLKQMSTPQILEAFKAAVARTAANLLEMARYWVELEGRGVDLTAYRNPMLSFLPDVACGKLLPEVLLRYGGNPTVCAAISGLVREDQKKLTKADPRIAVLQPDGSTRQARVGDLRIAELSQVFGDGRVRTVAEQQAHLAPAPRTFGTRQGKVLPINSDFDLYAIMSADQRRRVTVLADAIGMTPAAFCLDVLIRNKIIHGKPIDRRATASAA